MKKRRSVALALLLATSLVGAACGGGSGDGGGETAKLDEGTMWPTAFAALFGGVNCLA